MARDKRIKCDWQRGACSSLAPVRVGAHGFTYHYCERHAVQCAEAWMPLGDAVVWCFHVEPHGKERVPVEGLDPARFVLLMRERDRAARARRAFFGRGRWRWVPE